jgi:hypothetical protein
VSRSASEPDSASLHQPQAANLPKKAKPVIDGETTGVGIRRACRGDWGRRAWTDRPRNLGGPARWAALHAQRRGGRHNPASGRGRESDRLVVAKKRLIPVERRGRTGNMLL